MLKQPYKDWLHPLSSDEFEALKADVKLRGVLQPIIIDELDNILDGHHRYRCDRDAPTIVLKGLSDGEKKAFVISSNNKRRNSTPEQKAENRKRSIEIANELKAEDPKKWTQPKIAVALGVSQFTISQWMDFSNIGSNKAKLDARIIVTPEKKAEIPELIAAGIPQKQIAANLGISEGRVSQLVSQQSKREAVTDRLNDIAVVTAKKIQGVYDVVVIDPPWPMEKIEREVAPNQTGFDYPTMSEDELLALRLPVADIAHVWLWTTHRFLPLAFRLLSHWDLKYVCTFVWHKPGGFQPFGLPQYNCEFALYARCGSPQFVETKKFLTCFNAPRGEHSEKPEEFYAMVRRVTAGRRIDMFNRRAIEGFDGWGNESK